MDIRRTRARGLVVAARTTALVLIATIAASVSGGTLSYFTLYIGAVLPIPVMTGFQAYPPTWLRTRHLWPPARPPFAQALIAQLCVLAWWMGGYTITALAIHLTRGVSRVTVTPYVIQLAVINAIGGAAWAFLLAWIDAHRPADRDPGEGQDDTQAADRSGPLHDPAISLVDPLPRKEGAAPADNGRASADGAPAPLAVQASPTYRGSSTSARPHSAEDEDRNEAT